MRVKEERLRLLVAGLMLLAALVRAAALAYPTMDSDMAMTGLMARGILEGRFPVFFQGQAYCGAIEAYLAAPVFALVGSGRYALFITVALVSLVFVWLCWRVARDMWGVRAGLWALAFAALPPYYLAWHSVLPRAAYIEIPILGLLLIWICFRLVHRRAGAGLYFLYGLTAGVGLWTHFLIAFTLVPTALYLWAARPRLVLSRSLAFIAAGFLLGSAPLWIYNLLHPGATLLFLARNQHPAGAGEVLLSFWSRGLPTLLGAWRDAGGQAVIPVVSHLVLVLAGGAGLWLAWSRRRALAGLWHRDRGQADGSELMLLVLLAGLLISMMMGEDAQRTRRHLVPLYSALIPLAGYVCAYWQRRRGLWVWALAGLVLFSNAAGVVDSSKLFNRRLREQARVEIRTSRELVRRLLQQGIRRIYTFRYWDSAVLSFDSEERVIAATPGDPHFPRYLEMIARDPSPAWLVRWQSGAVEEALTAAGARWKRLRVGPYFCYYRIRGPGHGLQEILPRRWGLNADPRPGEAPLALDGRLTVWSSGRPQRPEAFYHLDLGRVVSGVCLLRLLPGRTAEAPRALRVHVSTDGVHWQRVIRLQGYRGTLFHWCAGRLMMDPSHPRQDFYFSPRPVRHLRLVQYGRDRQGRFPWSIMELSLYRAQGAARPPSPPALVARARARGVRALFGDAVIRAFTPPGLRPPARSPLDRVGSALAVPSYAAPALAATLKQGGIGFSRENAGGYTLFSNLAGRNLAGLVFTGERVLLP